MLPLPVLSHLLPEVVSIEHKAIKHEAGIDVVGPFPADTLFYNALDGRYDAIVAMYHDQGLIPIKLLAFDKAVNVTIGLPIIRTSVDHGTAFDIVGKNKADPGSMKSAIALAADLVRHRAAAAVVGERAPFLERGQ